MTDTLRLAVQKAVTAALEEIEIEIAGAPSTMAGRVFRGRAVYGTSDPLPMITLLEVPTPGVDGQLAAPIDVDASYGNYELIIQAFCVDDDVNPTDPAHELLGLVKQRIVQEKKKLGYDQYGRSLGHPFGFEAITQVRIGSGTVRPPDGEVSDKAYFWSVLSLELVEDLDNPFVG